ncbi:MAG TPA: hypothetical protein VGH87_16935, partial [Polyangiaceae bacterium]
WAGQPSLYVATRREDGWIVETQWLSKRTFMLIGPSAFFSDRLAKRINTVDLRRTVATTLVLHARKCGDSRALAWTTEQYLRFRQDTYRLIEMNVATRTFYKHLMTGLGVGLMMGLLALTHVRPLVLVLAIGAYIVAVPLFVGRAATWAGGFMLHWTPLRLRRAIRGGDDS